LAVTTIIDAMNMIIDMISMTGGILPG
jgi:hypothetical protein